MAWGKRYHDRVELRAAVMEIARAGWRVASGRDFSDHDAADFLDRTVPEHERRALEATDAIVTAYGLAAAFVRDHGKDYQRLRPREATLRLMVFLGMHMRQPIDGPFRATAPFGTEAQA